MQAATGLSDLLSGEISHDKITKYLNSEDLGSKELWIYVFYRAWFRMVS